MIELRTLGALELTAADGRPLGAVLTQPRRSALLCYLALAPARGFRRRDTVLALFWPEQDDEEARHALRQSLYFLRRALDASAIVSRGGDEIAISPEHLRCDVAEFERAIDDHRFADALGFYRGDLLPGFHVSDAPEFERWLDDERRRLRQRAADAAWTLAEAPNADPRDAAKWGQRALSLSSGDELALRRLLVLLERLGDRAAAVRAYEDFARNLEREYELSPSEQSRALLAKIRAEQRVRSDRVVPPGSVRPSPNELASVPAPAAIRAADIVSKDDDPPAAAVAVPSRRPRSLGIGIAVAAMIVLTGLGAWRMVARTRAVVPLKPERVIVADFATATNDSTLGELVAHVLNSELARSSVLHVAGRPSISDALRRMRRSPDARLSSDIAREVATREQINLVVAGDVRAAGKGLILTASVIETAGGDVIAGASEHASDSSDVLMSIKRLSDRLRGGIGESRASIKATDRVWRLTTTSLSALRLHMAGSQAWWRGDNRTAASLFEGAIALDPEFAHAHLLLWTALEASGAPRGRGLRSMCARTSCATDSPIASVMRSKGNTI